MIGEPEGPHFHEDCIEKEGITEGNRVRLKDE